MNTVELARILNIGQSVISRSVQRGEKKLKILLTNLGLESDLPVS